MTFGKQRDTIQAILRGNKCIRPGSVYDPVSARIAEDLGFELGMLGGSTASLTVLGDPDVVIISLSELAETVRRITRAAKLPLMVDADHGFGNALSVRRTIEELEIRALPGSRSRTPCCRRLLGSPRCNCFRWTKASAR